MVVWGLVEDTVEPEVGPLRCLPGHPLTEPSARHRFGARMILRAHMVPRFIAIMATIVAGIMNLSWWAPVVGACALGLVSLTSPFGSFAMHARPGSEITSPVILFSSTLNCAAAALAAFVLGRVIGWFWGL